MVRSGIYPTMITPYLNGEIDYKNVEALVNWYRKNGCTGIFAVCQSSEMNFLSLKERVRLATEVKNLAEGMSVVVSGHCASSIEAQAEEINEISQCGGDAFVLVSNRLDIHHQGDDIWIENAERLLERIDTGLTLGIYECPMPYKRLLTPRILAWCKQVNRFAFIKDTCCNPEMLKQRLEILRGSGIKLFNANEQTLLYSLENGADGYSGIMANFHPDILAWLYNQFRTVPEKAQKLSDALSMIAFTEGEAYPCTAKYYLSHEGFEMDVYSRSASPEKLTSYQKLVMDQLFRHTNALRRLLAMEVFA